MCAARSGRSIRREKSKSAGGHAVPVVGVVVQVNNETNPESGTSLASRGEAQYRCDGVLSSVAAGTSGGRRGGAKSNDDAQAGIGRREKRDHVGALLPRLPSKRRCPRSDRDFPVTSCKPSAPLPLLWICIY